MAGVAVAVAVGVAVGVAEAVAVAVGVAVAVAVGVAVGVADAVAAGVPVGVAVAVAVGVGDGVGEGFTCVTVIIFSAVFWLVAPRESVTTRVAVNVPAFVYVCCTTGDPPLALGEPSPKLNV